MAIQKLGFVTQLRFRDCLIQQMAIALKTELELAQEDSKQYADSIATALGTHLLRRYREKQSIVKFICSFLNTNIQYWILEIYYKSRNQRIQCEKEKRQFVPARNTHS